MVGSGSPPTTFSEVSISFVVLSPVDCVVGLEAAGDFSVSLDDVFEAVLVNEPTALSTTEAPMDFSRRAGIARTSASEEIGRASTDTSFTPGIAGENWTKRPVAPTTAWTPVSIDNAVASTLFPDRHPLFGKSDGLEVGEILADFVPSVSVHVKRV